MVATIILIALVLFQIFCNVYVACTMTTEEMKSELITEQSKVGRVFANTYYALAWGLKLFAK